MPNKLNVRKALLVTIWIVVFIHFLKDITQDMLRIPTVLDVFGDIKEDISWLPTGLKWVVGVVLFILIYFPVVIFLDLRFDG